MPAAGAHAPARPSGRLFSSAPNNQLHSGLPILVPSKGRDRCCRHALTASTPPAICSPWSASSQRAEFSENRETTCAQQKERRSLGAGTQVSTQGLAVACPPPTPHYMRGACSRLPAACSLLAAADHPPPWREVATWVAAAAAQAREGLGLAAGPYLALAQAQRRDARRKLADRVRRLPAGGARGSAYVPFRERA